MEHATHSPAGRLSRTNRCSRLPTASAALPLPAAAERRRWAYRYVLAGPTDNMPECMEATQ
jgi:hypothetical protein